MSAHPGKTAPQNTQKAEPAEAGTSLRPALDTYRASLLQAGETGRRAERLLFSPHAHLLVWQPPGDAPGNELASLAQTWDLPEHDLAEDICGHMGCSRLRADLLVALGMPGFPGPPDAAGRPTTAGVRVYAPEQVQPSAADLLTLMGEMRQVALPQQPGPPDHALARAVLIAELSRLWNLPSGNVSATHPDVYLLAGVPSAARGEHTVVHVPQGPWNDPELDTLPQACVIWSALQPLLGNEPLHADDAAGLRVQMQRTGSLRSKASGKFGHLAPRLARRLDPGQMEVAGPLLERLRHSPCGTQVSGLSGSDIIRMRNVELSGGEWAVLTCVRTPPAHQTGRTPGAWDTLLRAYTYQAG